ncbi:MAG: 2-succinyl-5-enolpyruvyl-6-hydroxy-3-cyclohexene-1-carboxylic-acid synthase [Jiangellaceae bacterium]
MNPSTALARVLVDEMVRNGVRDVVLSPGSRNAPLAFALHAADSAGRLRLQVRIDERGAGYLALGLAKVRGIAAVVTTSGTAVANLHPAVLEAHHAGVALLLLTADRPEELRGVGANQTVDQVGIFGRSVRLFHEFTAPSDRTGQVAYWRSTLSRACVVARGSVSGDPGPVHLNVSLREPLAPDGAVGAWPESVDGRADGGPWTLAETIAPPEGPSTIGAVPRTLVVVGDAPLSAVAAAGFAARRNGWPVVAEPAARGGAGRNAVPCGPLLLVAAAWVAANRPDRVLAVGRPTLSREVAELLGGDAVPVEVVAVRPEWPDAARSVRQVHQLPALRSVAPTQVDGQFLAAWESAGGAAAVAVTKVLAAEAVPTGVAAVRAVLDALPAPSLLYLGSSSVTRDVDLVADALPAIVLANRGAAGIDGTVSAAVGAALGRSGRGPAYALIGDLTFLHDANGLVIGPGEPRPDLCVVVLNDDGGGIFGLLEPGAPEHAAAFERVFGTPHGVDLAALCAATGTPHEVVTLDGVAAALRPRPGLRVVEIRVDRTVHRDLHARLRAAVADALH